MQNEIENQIKKIEREKQKLKNLKSKISKEKFQKVYLIIERNFESLPENLKSELKNYYDFKKSEAKTKIKTVKNVENVNNNNIKS